MSGADILAACASNYAGYAITVVISGGIAVGLGFVKRLLDTLARKIEALGHKSEQMHKDMKRVADSLRPSPAISEVST